MCKFDTLVDIISVFQKVLMSRCHVAILEICSVCSGNKY